jgi:hypothetical protein
MEARCNSCILSFAQSAYSDQERERGDERGVEWREWERNGRRSNKIKRGEREGERERE